MWFAGFRFRQTVRARMRKGFELKIKDKGKNSVIAGGSSVVSCPFSGMPWQRATHRASLSRYPH